MPCKLPSDLIRPPSRHLRDVAVGETVYVQFGSMQPDREGFCYLNPDSELCDRSLFSIRVTRAEDGFHVFILRKGWTWELGKAETDGWLPVESVTKDLQPDLAR